MGWFTYTYTFTLTNDTSSSDERMPPIEIIKPPELSSDARPILQLAGLLTSHCCVASLASGSLGWPSSSVINYRCRVLISSVDRTTTVSVGRSFCLVDHLTSWLAGWLKKQVSERVSLIFMGSTFEISSLSIFSEPPVCSTSLVELALGRFSHNYLP